MTATFERYWDYALHVTQWTSALLGPPPGHVLRILGGAQSNDPVAGRFVNGFDDPTDFQNWFMDPTRTAAYLATV